MAGPKRSRVALAATVVLLAFLHFTLRPVIDSWIAGPNLLVAAVLITALRVRARTAAGLGFVLGLLEDAMAVSYFGLATLFLVLLGYLGARVRDLFVGEEPLFMGTYLFVGTWLYEAASYLALGSTSGALGQLFVRFPLDALATGAVGYLALPFIKVR